MSIASVLAGHTPWHVEQGDCRQLLRHLPSGTVDHIITDPPYERAVHARQVRLKRRTGVVRVVLPFAPIDARTRIVVARAMARLVRRWVLVFCDVEGIAAWRTSLQRAGLGYRRACIWVKPDSTPKFQGDGPAAGSEAIVCAHPVGTTRWNGGGRRGVFVRSRSDDRANPLRHPTQKPVGLMVELLTLFTDPGDLVVDPFCGAGSTGVACLRTGRRFIGFELKESFANRARARLTAEQRGLSLDAAEAGQTSIFDLLAGGSTR